MTIEKQEALEHAWHAVNSEQTWDVPIAFIITIIISISIWVLISVGVTIMLEHYEHKHISNSDGDGVLIAGIATGFVFAVVGFSACTVPVHGGYIKPDRIAKQNVKVLKAKKDMPTLKARLRHDNHKYEYLENHADNNLFKRDHAHKYKDAYYADKLRIARAKSLMSYRDPDNVAYAVHGGLHHVKKPRFIDRFVVKSGVIKAGPRDTGEE